jgi:hypothetical protein
MSEIIPPGMENDEPGITLTPPYDAITPNGIQYITRIWQINAKYQLVVSTMDAMQPYYMKAVSGTAPSGYRIGSREMTYRGLSVSELMRKYLDLLNQKLAMENGTAPRRAMAFVPRDV